MNMSESKELAPAGGGAIATASADRFNQTMIMVREALMNPNINPENAKVMAELLNNQEDRANKAEFNRDLNAAIMEMPVITKAGIITIPANRDKGTPERTQGRFARFEDIDRVVRPILQRHNLAMRFEVDESNKGISVRPILSHANGHTERGGAMHLPLDTSGAKNNVQGAGSAVSYGKRYTMCAALNIITEGSDDDGSLGRYAIDMPHERTITVLEQAEEAAAGGNYQEFFDAQGVKDRAWLVSSNHHERLGGVQPALTDQSKRADPPAQRRDPPAQQKSATPAGKHDVTTPDGWTAQYEEDCRDAADLETLQNVQTKGANGLGKLKEGYPELHKRAIDAGSAAHQRLTASSNAGLFGDDE